MNEHLSVMFLSFLGLIASSTGANTYIFASSSGGQLDQISSVPTDFPGSDPSAIKVEVTSANEASTGSYHIRGVITNLGSADLESVRVTALLYDNDNKTVGVTSCCYTDPSDVEAGRTASFDSFAQEEEVSGTPTSFRLSFDWSQ
jgi:hypothetical protein